MTNDDYEVIYHKAKQDATERLASEGWPFTIMDGIGFVEYSHEETMDVLRPGIFDEMLGLYPALEAADISDAVYDGINTAMEYYDDLRSGG